MYSAGGEGDIAALLRWNEVWLEVEFSPFAKCRMRVGDADVGEAPHHHQRGSGGIHIVVGGGCAHSDVEKFLPCVGSGKQSGERHLRLRGVGGDPLGVVGVGHGHYVAVAALRLYAHSMLRLGVVGLGRCLNPRGGGLPAVGAVGPHPYCLHVVEVPGREVGTGLHLHLRERQGDFHGHWLAAAGVVGDVGLLFAASSCKECHQQECRKF